LKLSAVSHQLSATSTEALVAGLARLQVGHQLLLDQRCRERGKQMLAMYIVRRKADG